MDTEEQYSQVPVCHNEQSHEVAVMCSKDSIIYVINKKVYIKLLVVIISNMVATHSTPAVTIHSHVLNPN